MAEDQRLFEALVRHAATTGFAERAGVAPAEVTAFFDRLRSTLGLPPPAPATTLYLHTDGAARGNPGPAGIGASISEESGAIVASVSRYVGENTNNFAEYHAVIAGLEEARSLKPEVLHIRLDSLLVVNQVKGLWRVKEKTLMPLVARVHELLRHFAHWDIAHIPREENGEADRLANLGIDQHGG